MTVTSLQEVPNRNPPEAITCSIGMAAALFDLSDGDFTKRFIKSKRIKLDRLHQVPMRRLLQIGAEYGYLKPKGWTW